MDHAGMDHGGMPGHQNGAGGGGMSHGQHVEEAPGQKPAELMIPGHGAQGGHGAHGGGTTTEDHQDGHGVVVREPPPPPPQSEGSSGNTGGEAVAADEPASVVSTGGAPVPQDSGLGPCYADLENKFYFTVDFEHAATHSGAYRVIGCEGTSPALVMWPGVEYEFVQADPTNWMHALGFGYYPDAPYIGAPELTMPGAAGAHDHSAHHGGSSCADDAGSEGGAHSAHGGADLAGHAGHAEHGHRAVDGGGNATGDDPCTPSPPAECTDPAWACDPGPGITQTPLYCVDGACQSFATLTNNITSRLDNYIPSFSVPLDQWKKHAYSVKLTIPVGSLTSQLFYYCHRHEGMSGVINVANAPPYNNALTTPWDPATYYPQQTTFDRACGTGQISAYHLRADTLCPNQEFLCSPHDDQFSQCMQAIDCKMNSEMRVEETDNPLALFMHQMVPHHENAISMARIALKYGPNATGWNSHTMDVKGLMLAIINNQAEQIQMMQSWLQAHHPQEPVYCGPDGVVVKSSNTP
jgi:hypothetical protein